MEDRGGLTAKGIVATMAIHHADGAWERYGALPAVKAGGVTHIYPSLSPDLPRFRDKSRNRGCMHPKVCDGGSEFLVCFDGR